MITIPSFESGQVVVLGDVMLDSYWHGGASRISPEAPVPVVNVQQIDLRPGGAANVAVNIASVGCDVSLFGLCGDDENKIALEEKLQQSGVNTHFTMLKDKPTITKLRVLSQFQQLLRMDFEHQLVNEDKSVLYRAFLQAVPSTSVVVFSDYGKGTLSGVSHLIAEVRKQNKRVLVDPKGSDFKKYTGASIVTPNLKEFQHIVGHCANDDILAERALALIKALSLEAMLITRGSDGMSLVQATGEVLHLKTKAKEVYDVTGAGDTVIGVFAASLAAGENMSDAMLLANHAAGIVVGKVGTSKVTKKELASCLDITSSSTLSLAEFERILKNKNKQKIYLYDCPKEILSFVQLNQLKQFKNESIKLYAHVCADREFASMQQAMLEACDCFDGVVVSYQVEQTTLETLRARHALKTFHFPLEEEVPACTQ